MKIIWSFLITVLQYVQKNNFCLADKDSSRLLNDLLNHYNIYERPILNASDKVIINFGVALHQIIGLDERSQTIETVIFFKYSWLDVNLDWEPSEYGDIRELHLPISIIWKPDILLYNSADTPWDRTYPATAVLYHNGTIRWTPPSYTKSNCKVDVTYFPFDDQICHFKYSSWTYDYTKLDLRNDSSVVDTSYYISSSAWNLIETKAVRRVISYDCCPNPYVDVTFYIHLRRRTLSYGANLIVPTMMMSLMAILVFALPSESCEKVALAISVFLSLLFCLQIVADQSPPTSESIPLLGLFFLCCTVLVALSIVMSIVVLNYHQSDPDTADMGDLEKLILLKWLPKLVGVTRPPMDTRRFATKKKPKTSSKSNLKTKIKMVNNIPTCEECNENLLPPCTCGDMIEMKSTTQNVEESSEEFDDSEDEKLEEPPPSYTSIFRNEKSSLREIQTRLRTKISLRDQGANSNFARIQRSWNFENEVVAKMAERIDVPFRRINNFIKKSAKDDATKNDWQFAAAAIDRLCLYLFFGLIVTITLAFYYSAPHIVA